MAAAFLLSSLVFSACADKEAAGILYIKALESYKQKDFLTAADFIERSVACDKKNRQAQFLMAKIFLFSGKYSEAKKAFCELRKKEPDNKDVQHFLIQSLIFLEDYENAKKEIEEAVKKDAGDWRLYYLASAVAAKEGKVEEHLENLNLAQSAIAPGAQIFFDLAFLWQSLGIDSKAEEWKDKCLCLDRSYEIFFKEKKNE